MFFNQPISRGTEILYGRLLMIWRGSAMSSATLVCMASPLMICSLSPVFSRISFMMAMQRSSISITVKLSGSALKAARVKPPGPGPISQRLLPEKSFRFWRCKDNWMILSVMFLSSKKFCPKAFLANKPWESTVRRKDGSAAIFQTVQTFSYAALWRHAGGHCAGVWLKLLPSVLFSINCLISFLVGSLGLSRWGS